MTLGLRIFASTLLLCFTAGCVTPLPKALERVEPSMDKSQVLEIAGNPKTTRRQSGRDHWIYLYYIDDEEFRREIQFEQGKVVHIAPSTSITKEVLSPEKARSMEELKERSGNGTSPDPDSDSDDSGFQEM